MLCLLVHFNAAYELSLLTGSPVLCTLHIDSSATSLLIYLYTQNVAYTIFSDILRYVATTLFAILVLEKSINIKNNYIWAF